MFEDDEGKMEKINGEDATISNTVHINQNSEIETAEVGIEAEAITDINI